MDKNPQERTTAETFVIYAALLWHWAWVLVLSAVLAGASVFWQSRKQIPVYEASTTVAIDAAPNSTALGYTDSNQIYNSQQLATTFAQEMTMAPVLAGVAARLNLPAFPGTAGVTATPIQNTQLITIVVQDTDPNRAATLANALVQVFSDQIQADNASRYAAVQKSLEDQLASLDLKIQATAALLEGLADNPSGQAQQQTILDGYRQSYTNAQNSLQQVQLLIAQSSSGIIQKDPAVPSPAPISPKPVRDSALAAVTGLLIAAGGVFLVEFLDDTIRDPEELTRRFGVPVLGTIVTFPHDKETLITVTEPRSPITEAFRSLRTNLQFASFNLPVHTILVTSPSPMDGKTTVAANLASVIAQGGRKAVLVDADLRRPRVHRILGVTNRLGLSNLFIWTQGHLDGSVKSTAVEGLSVLGSGNMPPNPSELLGSVRMKEILHELAAQFETVIVDAPPLLLVTDALALAPIVDGVLIVVKPSITKRAALKNMLDQLRQVNATVLGIVLNDVKITRSHYYNYRGYYYNHKYGKDKGYKEGAVDPAEGDPNFDPTQPVVMKGLLAAQKLPPTRPENKPRQP